MRKDGVWGTPTEIDAVVKAWAVRPPAGRPAAKPKASAGKSGDVAIARRKRCRFAWRIRVTQGWRS